MMDAERIVASDLTVADKIRALAAEGYPRAEIARLLGKRYQHVRNVLEADKLRPPAVAAVISGGSPGVGEAAAPFEGVLKLSVGADSSVRLPPEFLNALGTRPGGVIIAELGEGRATLLGPRAAMAKVDAIMAPYKWKGGPFVSDQLIADRRAEAAREADD